MLSRPITGEKLYLYLAVSENAVSSALIRLENGVQKPTYYTSKAFRGAEIRYPKLEKLALALIEASRRMRPYFQAHTIIVYTDMPLRQALHKPEKLGRLMYWAIELGEYDIVYEPRSSLKGQVVADFIAEFTYPDTPEEQKLLDDQPVDVTGSTNTSSDQLRLVKGLVNIEGSSNSSSDQLRLVKG